MSRLLYSLAWWLATPLVMAYLLWRSRLQPEYRSHWAERWALVPTPRLDGPLIWIHAVSVGETRAAQPLVNALLEREPTLTILLTHMTPTGRQTGAELFGKRHGSRLIQRYLPYDTFDAPRRFLRAWHPQLGIVMETELWPNLCAAALALDVPLALVNARLSERSLQKGLRWQSLTGPAIACLPLVIAQTEEDAKRIRQLGRDQVQVAGNLKFDIDPPAELIARGRGWRAVFEDRPILLAASTRDGEEALLLRAWKDLLQAQAYEHEHEHEHEQPRPSRRKPLLVIVPRHPQRFDEVEREIRAQGLQLVRRSAFLSDPESAQTQTQVEAQEKAQAITQQQPGAPEVNVMLGDSMGEMFAYYGMSDVAIIGGSLLPFGAQNLIEACSAGVPVLLGPHTYNFADAAEQAIAAGAALRVPDAAAAMQIGLDLLARDSQRAQKARSAIEFTQAHRGATRRTLELLDDLTARR